MLAAWGNPSDTRGQGLQGAAAWLPVRPHSVLLGLPRQGCLGSGGGGSPAPCQRALRAWYTVSSKVRQTAAGPAAQPFLLSALCSGPFDLGTRPLYAVLASLGRPDPPTAGDCLCIWR